MAGVSWNIWAPTAKADADCVRESKGAPGKGESPPWMGGPSDVCTSSLQNRRELLCKVFLSFFSSGMRELGGGDGSLPLDNFSTVDDLGAECRGDRCSRGVGVGGFVCVR